MFKEDSLSLKPRAIVMGKESGNVKPSNHRENKWAFQVQTSYRTLVNLQANHTYVFWLIDTHLLLEKPLIVDTNKFPALTPNENVFVVS